MAQRIRHLTTNQKIAGSNPAGETLTLGGNMATKEDKVAAVAMALYTQFGTPYGTPFAGHLANLCNELAKTAVEVVENLPE